MSGNGLSHKDALCTRCLLKVNRYHKEINGPTAGDARGPRDLAGRPRQYTVFAAIHGELPNITCLVVPIAERHPWDPAQAHGGLEHGLVERRVFRLAPGAPESYP